MAAKIARAWREARLRLAGGVNSPVRAFDAVGGDPVFMKRGKGAYLFDIEGRRYIDYCLSWGALLFGHADTRTVSAICMQAANGVSELRAVGPVPAHDVVEAGQPGG